MSEYAICGSCYQRLGAVNELESKIAELQEAVRSLLSYRNIPCSGDTRCEDEDCALLSHNHIIAKTKEARDALATLKAAIPENEK